MKKILLAAALTACAAPVFAEPSVLLKVTGRLTNSSCTPTVGNGGGVNYGEVALNTLSATSVNQLGQQSVDLNIHCASATKVSWNFADNHPDSVANIEVSDANLSGAAVTAGTANRLYGVGKTAGGVNIGNFAIYVKTDSVVSDSNPVDVLYMTNNDKAWAKTTTGEGVGANIRDYTVATQGTAAPLAFIDATFPLVTSLAVQDTTTLAITDNTDIKGQLTISLRYL